MDLNNRRSARLCTKQLVVAATSQIVGNVGRFVRRLCWEEVGVEANGLRSSHRKEAVKQVSGTATKSSTMPSVKKALITVHKEWLRKCVTDVLGSVPDCYVRSMLHDRHGSLLAATIQSYEVHGEVR